MTRLQALESFRILDSLPEQSYDDIVMLAAHICAVQIALISLIDSERQWFKAKVGLEVPQTPCELAFCAHAILNPAAAGPGDFGVGPANHDRFADRAQEPACL